MDYRNLQGPTPATPGRPTILVVDDQVDLRDCSPSRFTSMSCSPRCAVRLDELYDRVNAK